MSNSFLKKKYIQDLILKDCDDYTIEVLSNRTIDAPSGSESPSAPSIFRFSGPGPRCENEIYES